MNTNSHCISNTAPQSRILRQDATCLESPRDAFTILELAALILVLAFLSAMLVPTLSRTQANGRTVRCLHNTRALIMAWQMYAQENHDKTVPVVHGGAAQGGNFDPIIGPPWAEGWLDWTSLPDNTNINFLISERYARLAKYLNGDTDAFKCPSDTYLSSVQRARHWTRRVRSYSANVGVGQGNAEQGPWDQIYKHVLKTTDFQYPGPAGSYVFIEEHPDSINDPAIFSPYQTSWVDLPATHHNGGTSVSFADGHCELHKWVASLTRVRGVGFSFPQITGPVGDPDIHWMSYHTARVAPRSF